MNDLIDYRLSKHLQDAETATDKAEAYRRAYLDCKADRAPVRPHAKVIEGTCGSCRHAHTLAPGRIVCQQVVDDGHISSSSPVELSTSMACPSHKPTQGP